MTSLTPFQRFWLRVKKTKSCWLWRGSFVGMGYGKFTVDGKTVRAHRWIYESVSGPLPPDVFVLHSCDNPPCVRIGHLFLGSAAENMRDRKAKGRYAVGENHHNAKLSKVTVGIIKRRIAQGESSISISKDFGVSPDCVKDIKRRRTYLCYAI